MCPRPDRFLSIRTDGLATAITEISDPEKPSEGGSIPSSGKRGEPSPSELQRIREVAGRALAPHLTGQLSICGPGCPDSGGERLPVSSLLSKKLGEEGYIFTLYLDPVILESVVRHSGGAGLRGTVAVSFGVSIPSLEPLTT